MALTFFCRNVFSVVCTGDNWLDRIRARLSLCATWTIFVALTTLAAGTSTAGEPPVCFPERTVMGAAYLSDGEGNNFGVIRAGQTVRVLETGIGKDGAYSKVEIDKPLKVTAVVPSHALMVFAKDEIDIVPGFFLVLRGAAVHIEDAATGMVFISAGACCSEENTWRTSVACDRLTSVANIARRSPCYGAHASVTLKWVGDDKVYWENDIDVVSIDGKNHLGLPRMYHVSFIEACGEYAHIGYSDWQSGTAFHGLVPLEGMKEATGGQGIGTCCFGTLPTPTDKIRKTILGRWDPSQPKKHDTNLQREERKSLQASKNAKMRSALNLPCANLIDSAGLRGREDGPVLATIPPGTKVYVGETSGSSTLVGLRWPTWDDAAFTFELYGYVQSESIERLEPESKPK